MGTPPIAHFGTTIIEAPPPKGTDQRDVPKAGALGDQLAFLEALGFAPAMENMYPGMGRQFIWRRGEPDDVNYIELDNFTSYAASDRPATSGSPPASSYPMIPSARPSHVTEGSARGRGPTGRARDVHLAIGLDGAIELLLGHGKRERPGAQECADDELRPAYPEARHDEAAPPPWVLGRD